MRRSVWALGLALMAAPAAWAESGYSSQSVSPGIQHTFFREWKNNGWLNCHLLSVDLTEPNIRLRLGLANNQINKQENVYSIAKRQGALAAINGSFFQIDTGSRPSPVGMVMVDGQIVYDSRHRRTSLGLTSRNDVVIGVPKISVLVTQPDQGKVVRLDGINQTRRQGQTVLYTPHFGKYTHTNEWGREVVIRHNRIDRYSYGNTRIPEDGYVLSIHGAGTDVKERYPIGSRIDIQTLKTPPWEEVETLITGGPHLVKNGEIHNTYFQEGMHNSIMRPAARSAIGVTHNKKLLLLTVNPTQAKQGGVTFTELAKMLQRLGAVEAMGLDGGGSSTLFLRGKVVNRNSWLRPVSNALLIVKPNP